jgi:hypothetical protein
VTTSECLRRAEVPTTLPVLKQVEDETLDFLPVIGPKSWHHVKVRGVGIDNDGLRILLELFDVLGTFVDIHVSVDGALFRQETQIPIREVIPI